MGPKVWAFLTVSCVIGSGISHAGSTDPETPIYVKVAGTPPSAADLQQARALVSDIYKQAGVELRWSEPAAVVPISRQLTIVLTTRKAAPAGVRVDAMGVAPTPGDGSRGGVAYLFIDAVDEFVAAHRVPWSFVAGCAMAHEIGHLLLPPNAHRPDGIMRGRWRPEDFPPMSPGVPGFPADQGRLLKLRADSR